MDAHTRRWDLRLVLGLTLAVGAISPWFGGIRSGNELSRIYLTEALLVDGTVAIDGAMARHGDTGDKSQVGERHFSDKAPGTSLAALPAVALYRALVDAPTLAGQVRAARVATSVLPTLLLLWVLLGWLREVVDGGTARAVVVAVALGSLCTTYGTLLFGHQLAGVSVLLAWLATRRLRTERATRGASDGDRLDEVQRSTRRLRTERATRGASDGDRLDVVQRSTRRLRTERATRGASDGATRPQRAAAAVTAGFFAGFAVLVEYTSAIYMLPIGVAFVWWSRLRLSTLGLALAGAALPVATLLLYHQAAFGHPLRTGYDFLVNPYFAELHTSGWRGFGWPRFERLGLHFVSPRKGLFFFAPWLVLAVPGGVALLRSRLRREAPVVLGVVGVSVLALLAMPNDNGGWTLGQRYLTGLVPWLAWLVAWALAREARDGGTSDRDWSAKPEVDAPATRWPALRPVFVGLVGVALVLTGLATAMFPFYPEHGNHPTMQFGWPLAQAGVDGGGLWNGVGLSSLEGASLVAVAALAGLLVWLAKGAPKQRWVPVLGALIIVVASLVGVAHMRPGPGPVKLREAILERVRPTH